jgi:oligopeptide transport system substrate-binding protein
MPHFLRRVFPFLAFALLIAALAWAVSFGTLPPADFTFDNNTEVETIDPALATGQPENRIINGLFEGLLRHMPVEGWEKAAGPRQNVAMTPQPAMAEMPEISPDGKIYTFRIRPGMQWSDGSSVTAEDFAWSWMRMLHPETGSKYAYQLYYVAGAKAFNTAQVEVGGQVEVELTRPNRLQLFPRGPIERGILRVIHKPPAPVHAENADDETRSKAESRWKEAWVYAVEIGGALKLFAKDPASARKSNLRLLRPHSTI